MVLRNLVISLLFATYVMLSYKISAPRKLKKKLLEAQKEAEWWKQGAIDHATAAYESGFQLRYRNPVRKLGPYFEEF